MAIAQEKHGEFRGAPRPCRVRDGMLSRPHEPTPSWAQTPHDSLHAYTHTHLHAHAHPRKHTHIWERGCVVTRPSRCNATGLTASLSILEMCWTLGCSNLLKYNPRVCKSVYILYAGSNARSIPKHTLSRMECPINSKTHACTHPRTFVIYL